MDPPGVVKKKELMTKFRFLKKHSKKKVRYWAGCVHSQWAVFPAMVEAATDEEH